MVSSAIGGEDIGETVEGLARYPINVRYPREIRDSVESLRNLPILTNTGSQITLGTVARITLRDGPPMLKTENARPSGWVYIDARGRDLASIVSDLKAAVAKRIQLKPGMSLTYSGPRHGFRDHESDCRTHGRWDVDRTPSIHVCHPCRLSAHAAAADDTIVDRARCGLLSLKMLAAIGGLMIGLASGRRRNRRP